MDSYYLEQDYDFVIGILTPDSLRDYPQEIFVGRIFDRKVAEPVPEGLDPVVLRVSVTMHNEYLGLVVGTDSAEVSVADEYGNTVHFEDMGNGIYRDVRGDLQVKPLKKYYLEVKKGDTTYTSETLVPGDFAVTNIGELDTVDVVVSLTPSGTLYTGLLRLNWSESQHRYFFRIEHNKSTFTFTSLDHTFVLDDAQVALSLDTTRYPLNTIVDVNTKFCAIDSHYARIYWPGSAWTGSDEFFRYMDSTRWLPLPQRSNIRGSEDVVGVFGSYNQTKKHFYMRAVRE